MSRPALPSWLLGEARDAKVPLSGKQKILPDHIHCTCDQLGVQDSAHPPGTCMFPTLFGKHTNLSCLRDTSTSSALGILSLAACDSGAPWGQVCFYQSSTMTHRRLKLLIEVADCDCQFVSFVTFGLPGWGLHF